MPEGARFFVSVGPQDLIDVTQAGASITDLRKWSQSVPQDLIDVTASFGQSACVAMQVVIGTRVPSPCRSPSIVGRSIDCYPASLHQQQKPVLSSSPSTSDDSPRFSEPTCQDHLPATARPLGGCCLAGPPTLYGQLVLLQPFERLYKHGTSVRSIFHRLVDNGGLRLFARDCNVECREVR